MTAAAKGKADAFSALLCAMQATYEGEIQRLVAVYRQRVLAGEFSGHDENGDVAYMRLEDEIRKTHPWITGGERSRHAVIACSRWLVASEKACTNAKTGTTISLCWDVDCADQIAAECMAHDVLAVAAARGWVKPLRFISVPEPYALRVA